LHFDFAVDLKNFRFADAGYEIIIIEIANFVKSYFKIYFLIIILKIEIVVG